MRQLRKLSVLQGYRLHAQDGVIGRLQQIYFDDESWSVRYLVVKTGSWLLGREVLVVPAMIEGVDEEHKTIDVKLTCEQIEKSPLVDTELPVSRHYEKEYYKYYGWDPYWLSDPLFDTAPSMPPPLETEPPRLPEHPHLRSSAEVLDYHIKALDGDIGHLKDFLLDDQDWTVRYLEIRTGTWLPGKKVLISTPWVETIDWTEQVISVDLSRDKIESAPAYDPSRVVSRDDEVELYSHYGKSYPPDA